MGGFESPLAGGSRLGWKDSSGGGMGYLGFDRSGLGRSRHRRHRWSLPLGVGYIWDVRVVIVIEQLVWLGRGLWRVVVVVVVAWIGFGFGIVLIGVGVVWIGFGIVLIGPLIGVGVVVGVGVAPFDLFWVVPWLL